MFEAGLTSLIAQDPGVSAQLGGSPFSRKDGHNGIFPVEMPKEATAPAIVYLEVASQSVASVQGTNSLQMKRMQFDCYGPTFPRAKALQNALRDLLLGYSGDLEDGSSIDSVLINLEFDAYDKGSLLFRCTSDYNIWCVAT